MTITYPLALPAPAPKNIKMTTDAAVAGAESPFTFEEQIYKHQGQRFMADITLARMRRSSFAAWAAWGMKLNGRQGTFLMGDPDAKVPRGVATGTPLVNGASQVGQTLITDGWTVNVTGILKQYDYIQLGTGLTTRMHAVLDDVNSDSGGNATLSIWPALRYSPADNAVIVTTACKTLFRLNAPFSWDADEVSTYDVVFSASEALP